MNQHTCPNCGCRVYNLGCVNCNEMDYIHEQERLDDLHASERQGERVMSMEEALAADQEKLYALGAEERPE